MKGTLPPSRRDVLLRALFGAGLLGLRSFATGLPISLLASPRRAFADPGKLANAAQYVLLSSSAEGDPVGTNAPGTYLDPKLLHPSDPAMSPQPMRIGGSMWTAAAPWTQLPADLVARTCFFHHATYTVVHADHMKVMALNGHSTTGEMFASLLAADLGPKLGTVRNEPIVLGPRQASEDLIYQGRPQAILAPAALSRLFGKPEGMVGQLTNMRDADLDRINAWLKSEGTKQQAAFVDSYVQSQSQLRSLSQSLLANLAAIQDDGYQSQIRAAITLFQLKVAPVISVHVPFGGDNHADPGLVAETRENRTGIAALADTWSQLRAVGMQDTVSFLSFNVFGRTMAAATNTAGRAHNQNHHMALMFGPAFRGSVIGGVEPVDGDYGAMSIDAASGRGVAGGAGDVAIGDSMQAMALTFGQGVGADVTALAGSISGGKPIAAALVST